MEDLKQTKLSRPLDKQALANDNATLRSLVAQLNNPELTGAEVPIEEKPAAPVPPIKNDLPKTDLPIPTTPPTPTPTPPAAPIAPPPAVTVPPKVGGRLLMTGRAAAVTLAQEIGQQVSIASPVIALAHALLGDTNLIWESSERGKETPGASAFLASLKAFGAREYSPAYPLTVARAVFVKMIQSLATTGSLPPGINWAQFGRDDGFWTDSAVAMAKSLFEDGQRVTVTGISTNEELNYFRSIGFSHWHVMSGPQTVSDPLTQALDNSVTEQISKQRNGPKLRCIWASKMPSPSHRLWTVDEFKSLL